MLSTNFIFCNASLYSYLSKETSFKVFMRTKGMETTEQQIQIHAVSERPTLPLAMDSISVPDKIKYMTETPRMMEE